MREAQLVPFVTAEIEKRFDEDEAGMATALEVIAGDVDDGLADWLARAENPAAWLYKQF